MEGAENGVEEFERKVDLAFGGEKGRGVACSGVGADEDEEVGEVGDAGAEVGFWGVGVAIFPLRIYC
jgi:hypothetical protein